MLHRVYNVYFNLVQTFTYLLFLSNHRKKSYFINKNTMREIKTANVNFNQIESNTRGREE